MKLSKHIFPHYSGESATYYMDSEFSFNGERPDELIRLAHFIVCGTKVLKSRLYLEDILDNCSLVEVES